MMHVMLSLRRLLLAFILLAQYTLAMRVALVTGGTRGIGKGIVQQLASTKECDGFCLSYNTDRVTAELFRDQLLQEYPHLKIALASGDLSLESTRDDMFATLDQEFEGYDLVAVVHNAGQYIGITSKNVAGLDDTSRVFGDGSLLAENGKVDLEAMHYYQRLYGDAYVDLCERGLARMRNAAERCKSNNEVFRGSLIGIGSPTCNIMQRPDPSYSMPGSGKSLMEYANRIYAVQAAKLGVNVNVVIPGVTVTEGWERMEQKQSLEKNAILDSAIKRIPMGEPLKPRDIGDVVAFLCGKGGGRFITGSSILVDGGMHMRF